MLMAVLVSDLDFLITQIESALERRGLSTSDASRSLWPAEYSDMTADCACDFIFGHVRTWEETSGQRLSVPDKDYLRQIAQEWHGCLTSGQPLHVVKSRRLIVSWFVGALELHLAGCRGVRIAIAARQFEGLAGARHFVWRAKAMYDDLRSERPAWKLPRASSTGSEAARELDTLSLPNGSFLAATNSDPEKFRGGGSAIVRLEELSSLPYVDALMAQAKTVTQGVPGTIGGMVCSISNASSSEAYLDLIGRKKS